jgi:hypothetical protein
LERIWKEAVVAYSTYCPGIVLEGLRKTTSHSADVEDEVRTEHLPNTSQESTDVSEQHIASNFRVEK